MESKLLNEKGFVYSETLIAITIFSIAFSACAMVGISFFANALAEFEATKLISELRFLQEHNRNSYVIKEGEFLGIEPKNSTILKMDISGGYYSIKAMSNGSVLKKYYPDKSVSFSKTQSFDGGIIFKPSGDVRTFGTVTVKANVAGKTAIRFVIIDRAGRIRMDRNAP